MEPRSRVPGWLATPWWVLFLANCLLDLVLEASADALHVHSHSDEIGSWLWTAWGLLQAGWLWRVDRRARAIFWYLGTMVCGLALGWGEARIPQGASHWKVVSVMLVVVAGIAGIAGIFVMRRDMARYFRETEGIDLGMNWWMTLLFSNLYFQYHFTWMYEVQQAEAARISARERSQSS